MDPARSRASERKLPAARFSLNPSKLESSTGPSELNWPAGSCKQPAKPADCPYGCYIPLQHLLVSVGDRKRLSVGTTSQLVHHRDAYRSS